MGFKEKLTPYQVITDLGQQFRCRECHQRGRRWMLGCAGVLRVSVISYLAQF